MVWSGTKGCRKKYLLSPQWLRNIKDKKYSLFRLDIIFSKIKYNSIKFIKDGGWHFSNIKSPEEIEHKLKSYLHHREFDEEPLSLDQIDNILYPTNGFQIDYYYESAHTNDSYIKSKLSFDYYHKIFEKYNRRAEAYLDRRKPVRWSFLRK